MSASRNRAAVLASLLTDPASKLNATCRDLGVDGAWAYLTSGHPDVPEAIRARLRGTHPDDFVERGVQCGARLVVPTDAEWPRALDDLGAQAPWALWVRGGANLSVFENRAVAIVGARACTEYGRRAAAQFSHDIAASGTAVVSGGAYGIDAAAHRGAIAGDGVTVAVLSCGIDIAYPLEHTALFERIAEGGLIVTEAAPGARPTKPSFLVRNRLIAALSYGTVVVEARLRSGSIATYAHARNLNRVLMAVPGPIDSAESAGTNQLLQHDAALVTSGTDVLSLVLPLGSIDAEPARAPDAEWDALREAERHVYECMPARAPVAIDRLQGQPPLFLTGMPLLAALASLAERGLAGECDDGRWRRLRALRGAGA